MNIFFLHHDYNIAAREHCDKHVVKMILEYTQLLSTAHRILDGILTNKRWVLKDEECKIENDVINFYKKFYIMKKYKFAT